MGRKVQSPGRELIEVKKINIRDQMPPEKTKIKYINVYSIFGINKKKYTSQLANRKPSRTLPHQAFLRARGDEHSISRKNLTAAKAPGTRGTRAILRIKQPVIDAHGPVKP